MNRCIFLGSFNPIHNAHLRIAEFACAEFNFDKIVFIPSFILPHKTDYNIPAIHRYNMVQLAIEHNNKFEISDIEFKKNQVSYSYLTVLELCKIYNTEKINLILGSDAFEKIETWYETDKLKQLVNFILFKRTDDFNFEQFDLLQKKGYNFKLMDLNFEDISSTQIRNFVKNKKDISKFVPQKVLEYIKENNLYEN